MKIKNLILAIGIILVFAITCYIEHNYTRDNCKVMNINDNIITVEDVCGLAWKCETANTELQVGDIVTLKMHDNNTGNYVYDDIVKDIIIK